MPDNNPKQINIAKSNTPLLFEAKDHPYLKGSNISQTSKPYFAEIGDTDFGQSDYDKTSPTSLETIKSGDYQYNRGEQQSGLAQLGLGVLRVGAKALVETAKTPGYLSALGEATFTDKTLAESLDNAYLNGLEGLEKTYKGAMPVYKSYKSGKGGLVDNFFSTSFWASEGADGLGYMVGMFAPGAALKGINLAAKAEKLFLKVGVKNALKASSLGEKVELGTQTLLNTFVEAGAESKGVADRGRSVFKDILNPESPNYNPINPATGKEWTKEEVDASIADGTRSTFLLNAFVLFGPNLIMNKNLLSRFNKDKSVLDKFRDINGNLMANPVIKKQFIKDYAKKVGIGIASEGFFEEGSQSSIENYEIKRLTGQTTDGLIKGLIDEYGNTLTTLEGQKSILLGSVLGGLGGVAGQYRQNKQFNQIKPTISKLISNNFKGFSDDLDIFERDDNGVIKNDKNGQPVINKEKALNYFYNLASESEEAQVKDLAAFDNNKLMYDYFSNKQFVRYSLPFIQQGALGLEILDDHIDKSSNSQLMTDQKELSETQGVSYDENKYKQQLKSKARELQVSYNQTLDVLKDLPFLQDFVKSNPKEGNKYINDLGNSVFQENAKQIFYKEKIQDLNRELMELNSSLSADLPQNQTIATKINKDIADLTRLLEKSKEDYKAIFSAEEQLAAFEQYKQDSKTEEKIANSEPVEEVETPEVKTKKEAKTEEVDKELQSKIEQLTTIDNFNDLNLLRNEIKNHPLHTKEMLNQINEKEKQLKSIVNTFAENIINNTLENNDNNQQFLKNNLEDIEKRIQELKAIKDTKKPVFDDILKQSGIEPGSEVEQDEQTEEEVNAQQKLVSEANSQGLFSDNESTQTQIDSEKSTSNIEKGINVKNNVVMVHIFDHYFENEVFKFDRNEEGFPKDDNVSKIDISALNGLKIGDKLDFELVKVSSEVEKIYRSLKDYDGKHIAIKHNGRLVGFVQQPHPVSPKSLNPVLSEIIREELIEYRKQVVSLINQGISVTEKVEDKGTGNLYTKINVTNSKKLIAADFNVFETARPQDKVNGSLVFVYADETGKLVLPKSSNQDFSPSDITSINKRLNELAGFKLKSGRVYQLVKDLTNNWYPMPVYANNINSKTLDNIEEVLGFANNSSETKDIIRDLQPYIYASSSRIGAMMAIIKENNKINVWANGKRISLDDFNNVDVLRKEFLKNMLGLPQNIDVININNPSVQEKMADRENLFTNVTTFEGEYFVQPYIEYSQNSMLRKETPITDNQVNNLSAVQPSSTPSTSVSTDVKADIERRRQEELNEIKNHTGSRTQAKSVQIGDKTFKLGEKIYLSNVNIDIDDSTPNYRTGTYTISMISLNINSKNGIITLGDGNELITPKISDIINAKYDAELATLGTDTKANIERRRQKELDNGTVILGDITLTREVNKYNATGNTIVNNKTGEGIFQLITPEGKVIYAPIIGKNFVKSINKYSGKNISEQAEVIFSGIPVNKIIDNYSKSINAKYDAELKALEQPSKPTAEDIKKQSFQDKLNRANNAIIKEKGASKTIDNTILNRNLFEKWLKKNLPQLNLSDVNNVFALKDTIIDAFGLFKDSTIFLFEGAGMKTAYHEAFHGVFRNLLTVKQREEIISEAKTKYPAPTLEDLNSLQKDLKNQYTEQQLTYLYYEEKIADSFATFVNDKNSRSLLGKLSDAIVNFFNKIIQYFNLFKSKETSALNSLFDNINNGKLATIKSNSNSVVNIPIFSEYAYSKKLNKQLGVSNKARTVEAIGNSFMAKYQEALLSGNKTIPLSVFQSILDVYSEKLMSLDENSDDFGLCGKIILNFPELISEVKKYLSIRNVKIKDEIQYKETPGELTTLNNNSGIEITTPLNVDEVEDNEIYTLESKAVKGFTDWTSISGLSSSSARMKLFLSSIPVLDYSKRVPVNVFDEFGIQKYWDFHELYVHIEDNLIDLYEFEEKIDKLKELTKNRPELKQVIDKLTNRPSSYTQAQFDLLQNDFDTNFNKQNLLYTLFKFDTDSSTGQTTHEIIESNRTSLARQLSDSWKSNVFDVNKKNIIGFYDKGEGKIDVKKAKKLLEEWNGLPETPKAKFVNTKLLKAGIEYSNDTLLKLVEENDPEWRNDVSIVLQYYASGLDLSQQKTFREAMFRLIGKEVDNSKNKNSSSFIDGRNKNIFAVQLPTFISKTIAKIKNRDKFAVWMSKLQQDPFYKNSNILSLLKNKSDFKENFKVSYVDSSKDSRGTREGVSFTKMTPKDYAITQIVAFRNLAVNSQKETSLPINKCFYLTPADKSMQVIIDSTSTQVMVDSKGELLIQSSPIIYNGQGNMHYYNVFLQEANRIKTNIDIKNDIISNKGKGKYKLNMLLENYHMSKGNFEELSKLVVKDELTEDDVNNLSKMFDGFAYKFNCFSNSFNKTLGKDLIEIIENSTKDNLESNLESIKKQVVTGIAKDIQDDFNTTLKEMISKGVIQKDSKTGLYSSKTIELVKKIDKFSNQEIERTLQDVNDDILNILVDFSANTKLNNIEFSNIFNGDIAKYKANNLAKRAPQAQTMTILGKFINKVIKTRVVKDVISKLDKKEYDEIFDSLKDSGFSDSEIKLISDPYLKTNVTDGEVYISPELYKRIHESMGTWSSEMQLAYDIAEGSSISEIPENLRRKLLGIKPFYFGDNFNEDLGIMDFQQIKCSMIPLFKAYTDLNPLLADIRKDMLKKDKNGNTTLDMVAHESAFKAALGFRNDIFDSTGSVTLNLSTDNFGLQTSNVDHIESGNDSTRQLKMLILGTIDKNKTYRGTNGKDLIDLITKLEATNIKESLKEVLVKLNVKDNVEFNKFIEASISKRKENINVEEGLLLENGDFKYALDSGNLSTQVENLISSVFTDNAVKQEFEIGGDAVQATSLGFKFKSEFRNLLEQQKNLTKEALIEQGKLKWIKPNKENGYIEFAECAMPAWTKKFFNEKGFLIDAENIPEELRELIVYRIPNEGLHTMLPIRVVKFLPETMGNFILLPYQITTQFGADFDFDKIFFIGKEFYKTINEDKEEYFRPYIYYPNQNETGLRYNDYLQYTSLNKLDQMDFNYFAKLSIEEQNVRPARNNEIINSYFKVLTDIKNLNLLIKPSSFEALTKFKQDNFSKEIEEDFFSSNTQRNLKDKNHVGIDLKGQVSLHVTGHSYGSLMNLSTASYIKLGKNDYKLVLDKTVNIDGEKRTNFSGLYNQDNKLISDEIASVLAGVLDDVSNPILKSLGIDNNTVDIFVSILRSGKRLEDALTFISQPIIKQLSANLTANTDKIKEFNQGQFSVDDLIDSCKAKAKEALNKVPNNSGENINWFFEKIEDNEFYIKTKDIKKYINNFNEDDFIKSGDQIEILKYWSNQARVLKQFKNIEIISKELVKTNKIFAINKEVGPNIEDIISKKEILSDLLNSKVLNGFDITKIPTLRETWNVHLSALKWFGDYFPYGSKTYMNIKQLLAFEQGSKNIAEYAVKDRIFMNSFIRTYSDYNSFLFKDVDKEYVKLLRELPAQINDIFKFHEEEKFLGTTSYSVLRNNVFLKEIKEYQDKDNSNYYLQLRGNRLNLQVKNNVISGLTALYSSEDPMVREFAIDLIKHSFLTTGFFKGVNSYASLISPEILDDLKIEGFFPGKIEPELQSYNEFRKNAIYNLNSEVLPNLPNSKRIVKQMIRNNPRAFSKVFDSKMFTEDATNGLPKTITTNKLKIKDAKRLKDMLWEDSEGIERSPLIISVFDEYIKKVKLYERNDNNVINSETKDDFSTITYDDITPLGKIGNLIEIYINEENPVSKLQNNNSDEDSNDDSQSEILGDDINIKLNNGQSESDETIMSTELRTTQPSTNVKKVYQGYDKLDNREFNYFTEEESEAKDYGANVREVELDTTGFLKIDNKDEYYNEVNEFSKISGIRFDILNNSKTGLENQAAFFNFLKSKGYKGLDMLGGVDSKYAVSFKSTQPSTSVESNLPGPDTKINIYAGARENAELSNFANRPFKLGDGTTYPTVEHAYQLEKLQYSNDYTDEQQEEIGKIINKGTAAQAKAFGRTVTGLKSKDWEQDSSNIMKDLIKQSFEQNPEALQKLLATGKATLTHTQDKGKWGTEFPRLLMEVRNELRTTQSSTSVESKTSSIPSERQIKVEQFNITIKPDGKMFYENGNEVTDQTTKNKVNVRKELQDKTLRSSVYNGANYFVLSDDRIVGSGKTNLGKESITDNTIKEKILAKAVTYKKEC